MTRNPNAIQLLENNIDKFDHSDYWVELSLNPNAVHLCFTYNYNEMKHKFRSFAEELARYVFRPFRLMEVCHLYEVEFDEYMEIIG